MNVELRPLAEIKPYEKNPRMNDAAVDAVAESIRRFGFRQPIVVDGDGVIVCGHTRWKAAQKLGLEQVPVHVAKDLTPEQIRAYRIADNKTAELAEWNMELLPIELAELQGAGIDWSLLGFDADDLLGHKDRPTGGDDRELGVRAGPQTGWADGGHDAGVQGVRSKMSYRSIQTCSYGWR
jgi:ParB-like chromosome segregation protein Spo0J